MLSPEYGQNDIPRKQRRKLFIIIAVVIGYIVAVAIGLAVGLTSKSCSSEGDQAALGDGNKSRDPSSTNPGTMTRGISTPPSSPQSSTTKDNADWLSAPCVNPTTATRCPWSKNPLLLVSLDGFRADYLLRNLTPTINKLRNCGVHTPYMRAVYPTLTFPNHYTIVTGLYPESHGIVGNSMYDPHINASFSIGGREKYKSAWWGGEPLWVTAKRHGKVTASYFWVGSEMNISGMQPDIWKRYDGKISFETRVDTVLEWLELPDTERPEFITLYFNEPDHQGHDHGPDSVQVNKALGGVDTTIRRLMDGLLKRNLDHCVNLIVLADHGMSETSCQRQVNLDKYMSGVGDMLIYSGTTGYINTKYRRINRHVVYENANVVQSDEVVKSLQCQNPHLNIFSQSTIPTRHHYTNNERIGNVVLDIDQSWLVYPKKRTTCLMGNHGYDNIYKSMHALFLAHGPDFKQNLVVEPFENIELYNLMTDVLHLDPAPNNGTAGALGHILRNFTTPTATPHPTAPVCAATHHAKSTGCACSNKVSLSPPSRSGVGVFPFGEPVIENDKGDCILHGSRYSALYSKLFKAPSMSSFSVTHVQVQNYSIVKVDDCLIPDERLDSEAAPDCVEYSNPSRDIEHVRLFDPGFIESNVDKTESQLSSNIVAMYNGFRDGIWAYVWRILKEYATKYRIIHVTVGPVYDYNFDGLLDTTLTNMTEYVNSSVPLPTHYYVILMKCSAPVINLADCNTDNTESLSFILPHHNTTNNCLTNKEFLLNNVARIRDIEHVTGLRFLTSYGHLPGARSRTYLPLELWSTLTT